MLINPNTSNINTFSNPRQIALFNTTSNQVMYTVPAGKKFVGYVYSYGSGAYNITPAGGSLVTLSTSQIAEAYKSTTPMLLTFVAGTIIANGAGAQTQLVGVESDL